MAKDPISIQLYDTDIEDLMRGWELDLRLPRAVPDHSGVFGPLQEQELIWAVSQKNYRRVYSLLSRLDHILSPADAMAACLCALTCTPKLMNALLDHCPPIPDFQFLGAGSCTSLLVTVVRYDRHRMLDLLLQRGADPGSGPTEHTAVSPVEQAFCSRSFLCLKRLLEIPALPVPLTEPMLDAWGELQDQTAPPLQDTTSLLWCCQLMLERLTGLPAPPLDPLPVPEALRLAHALRHDNPELALHICETRPLTEEDVHDVLAYYGSGSPLPGFFEDTQQASRSLYTKQAVEIRFLCRLLHQRPALLHAPQLRTVLALAALALPEEDPLLRRWTNRLEAGPVMLTQLPIRREPRLDAFLFVTTDSIAPAFFHRWEQRLGPRLVPTMDRSTPALQGLMPEDLRQVLQHIRFAGDPPPGALSAAAAQILRCAPEELLPPLLQPGELLAQEAPDLLLDACQRLPHTRRSLLLPYLRKRVDYAL